MANFLGIEGKSLGEYVDELGVNSYIVVMNVSLAPLQNLDSTICDKNMIEEIDSKVRKGYDKLKKHNNNDLNRIEQFLLGNFTERFKKIRLGSNSRVILCGNFAQTYFDESNLNKDCKGAKILRVPHPSRNQWKIFKDDLKQLEGILEE